MEDEIEIRPAFSNRRDWNSFLTALQGAATYPKVVVAMKSSRSWFAQRATHASSWLADGAELRNKVSVG